MSADPSAVTPYYSDHLVTLYHGDAGASTDLWDHEAVLITDPPYGHGYYPTDVLPPGALAEWVRAARGAAVFGYPEALALWVGKVGKRPTEWVTWWAPNARHGRHKGLVAETEAVAIFGATPGVGELRQPRSADSRRIARSPKSRKGANYDLDSGRMGDVWRDLKPSVMMQAGQRLHPNEKPLTLMRRLVLLCSLSSDVVIDPFCGSGTTLRAAKDLGRRTVGIEIDERYCEAAAKRLAQEVLDFGDAS